jgi:DNA-binding SARP family transcriptional activator/tetratricopeptide (TPR) repeat protein
MDESMETVRTRSDGAVCIRMLGSFAIHRDGLKLTLPSSRKVRALLAYLALAPRPVPRERLCELLWEIPNDPKGELRWTLSKIRGLLDTPDIQRVRADGEGISLDLTGCRVDAFDIVQAEKAGVETLDQERLTTLLTLFEGEFLEGLEIDRSPVFKSWLTAQRRRFHATRIAALERAVELSRCDTDEALGHVESWLALAPFDTRAHRHLLGALARSGRIGEGEAHVAGAARLFEAEGLDWGPLHEIWREAKRCVLRPASAGENSVWPLPAKPALPDLRQSSQDPSATRRGSIAVMPFAREGGWHGASDVFADGLVNDVISRLSKLRSLDVIARGSTFAMKARGIGASEAGRILNVDYIVSGSVRLHAGRAEVAVDLVALDRAAERSDRLVWTENLARDLDDAFLVLDEIGNRIVASIASEIETSERNRAILLPPQSLGAWEAYHRGLWHMYRFNAEDNDQAQHFFQMAVRLDPSFSRAYAGLSFTHFQNAFLLRTGEREKEIDRAFATAGQSLLVDDHNPAAHWAMGRALWLRGQDDQAIGELETAVELSPNFALGHYTLAFVHSQSGDAHAAVRASDHSRFLSPFDPLLFGMLGSRAMALFRLGEYEEAADWALKAASRPNAHVHILAIAAHCLAAVGRLDEARGFAATIHRDNPGYRTKDYLGAFHFPPEMERMFRSAAARIGMT